MTDQTNHIKTILDQLLQQCGLVASADMLLTPHVFAVPLKRPPTTIEGIWWPVSNRPDEISILDLMNEEVQSWQD